MSKQAYGFIFNGREVSPSSYGADYLPEFVAILERFPRVPPKRILEWGTGLTTQVLAEFAVNRWDADILLSLDENDAYQSAVFADRFRPKCLELKSIDLIGPGQSQRDPGLNFSTYPFMVSNRYDLIFIDARRRMECAFMALLLSNSETLTIIHDYRRSRYQAVIALFEVLQDGPQYRVMRPKESVLAAVRDGAVGLRMFFDCLRYNGVI